MHASSETYDIFIYNKTSKYKIQNTNHSNLEEEEEKWSYLRTPHTAREHMLMDIEHEHAKPLYRNINIFISQTDMYTIYLSEI